MAALRRRVVPASSIGATLRVTRVDVPADRPKGPTGFIVSFAAHHGETTAWRISDPFNVMPAGGAPFVGQIHLEVLASSPGEFAQFHKAEQERWFKRATD